MIALGRRADPRVGPASPRRNLRGMLVSAVASPLMQGEYPPGSPLGEVELAQCFGVSPEPVREVLKELEPEFTLMVFRDVFRASIQIQAQPLKIARFQDKGFLHRLYRLVLFVERCISDREISQGFGFLRIRPKRSLICPNRFQAPALCLKDVTQAVLSTRRSRPDSYRALKGLFRRRDLFQRQVRVSEILK